MKMRKNKNIGAVLIMLTLVVSLLAGCNNKREDNNSETEVEKKTDVKTITFTVPDICRVDEDKIKSFNDELVKDGHDYKLEVKYLAYEEYTDLLESKLESGQTDVAFLGLGDADGNNNVYSLINSDVVLNLDDILSEKQGAALYNAFPKNLWEAVKCNKHIYSIPSAVVDDQGVYAAFNRDYISDEAIDAWDGSIDGLYEIIKNAKWDNSGAYRFRYLLSDYSFDDMIACEIRYGLLFDYDSLTVENPQESEKYTGYMNVLDKMKSDGYMDSSVSYFDNQGLNSKTVLQQVEAGNYLVALSSGEVDNVFEKDNITVKKVKTYLSSRINGSIAISKNTTDVDAVVDFLGILYSNEKYGNILLYGLEGTDYKVVDNVACDMSGNDLEDDFVKKLCLDLFVNVVPVKGENYISDRKNEFFSFYDSIELSPFIGFEPDTTNMSGDMDTYLSSVRSQWEEYRK